METLFNEELGGVFQVRKKDETEFHRAFATCGPPKGLIRKIGRVPVQKKQELTIFHENQEVYRASRTYLQQRWASTSFQMQRLRDNPDCAEEEYSGISDNADPGLSYRLTFDPVENILPKLSSFMSTLSITNKPRVMILREQGINGAAEMAFAFMNAGFIAVDVHMSDIIEGRVTLDSFRGLAACGGFSYGDVLGAGQGWAKSVLLHPETRNQFRRFFGKLLEAQNGNRLTDSRTKRHFYPWRLQWLPIPLSRQIADPWCRAIPFLRQEPERTARGPCRYGRDP